MDSTNPLEFGLEALEDLGLLIVRDAPRAQKLNKAEERRQRIADLARAIPAARRPQPRQMICAAPRRRWA